MMLKGWRPPVRGPIDVPDPACHRSVMRAAFFAVTVLVGAVLAAYSTPIPVPFSVRLGAQAQTPLLGTWSFNPGRSTSDPDRIPFRRGTCRIEPWDDGVRVTYDLVRIRGGITHLEWTGRFDGQDYPLEGVEADVTNAYKRIDDRTYQIIQKVNGLVVLTERLNISPDGRTVTTVALIRDAGGREIAITTVYDKK
jgi:hypothetical protein